MKHEQIETLNDEQFRRCTGITKAIFKKMVEVLTEHYNETHSKGGRKPKLCIEDQILLTLSYYREYRTQFHIGLDYGVSESTTCKIIKKVETVIIQDNQFSLPSKRELMQDNDIDVVLIDATEIAVERPKKTKK